jgi:Flp pilus assembly secretin CpaC
MIPSKIVLPIILACAIGLPVAAYTFVAVDSSMASASSLSVIEPSAPGTPEETPAESPVVSPAQVTETDVIQPVDPTVLQDPNDPADILDMSALPDAEEMPPLRISPDKPEILRLDRDAVNVVVGSDEHLRVVPDTNRTLILIPKKPGSTFFKALDTNGNVIMQRAVIIGGSQPQYIRIRRACINGAEGCKEYSMYYCPDTCHEVAVKQDVKAAATAPVPEGTPPSTPEAAPAEEGAVGSDAAVPAPTGTVTPPQE